MKKLLLILSIFCFISFNNAEMIEMTIAYENKEQPPYYMGNTDDVLSAKPGVAVEMVKMLEEKIPGLKINLTRRPWRRCTAELEHNDVDGIFNASYSKERLSIGWYPTVDNTHKGDVDENRRITTITYSIYTLNDSKLEWDGKNFSYLNGKIGAPFGYSVVNDLKKMGVEVEEAPSTTNNLDKLLLNRIVAVALQDVTADNIIKNDPDKYNSLKKIDTPLFSKHYYLMLSDEFVKKNPDLAQKIWNAIGDIRVSSFDKLLEKYSE